MSGPAWNGNTAGGTAPREKDDAYFTPDALALAICRRLDGVLGPLARPSVVIEPSAGDGAFVRAAASVWLEADVIAIDPNDNERLAKETEDPRITFHQATFEMFDDFMGRGDAVPALIIGNPPFKLAEEHVALALRNLRPNEHLCFLLRASFLAGQGRYQQLHKDGCLRYVWNVIGRPSFVRGATDTAEYIVAVWQAGYRGPYEGGWLTWKAGRS